MKTATTRERGMSLVEVLVATAILSVAVVVALTVYDASRKAFTRGENATEQQESIRIAYDKIVSDLRMLGLNTNPDGDPARPDEQLEGALDHAIIFRADFDGSDPVASSTPEAALAAGPLHNVSTGNDEIVAYVLSRPDGTGPDTITFQADVREPVRDGRVEPVSIPNVVLNPTSPPYTLYRVTLNNDSSTYGSAGFIVRTPVVENVRDMSFIYQGTSGPFEDSSAAIPETPEAKSARSDLSRVHVALVGMTRRQDLNYVDPGDPAALHYRKFELQGDVTPRNMRLKGIQDINADVTPPGKPATPTLIPGHCKGLLVIWPGNPASDGVTQYRVNWVSSVGGGSRNLSGPPLYLDQLADGTTYVVTIQAQDANGNVGVKSDPASATTSNHNTPSAPTGLTTTTDLTYRVSIAWSSVTTNTASVPPADPLAPRIRDLAGYRIYRDADPTVPFNHDDWSLVADESIVYPAFQQPYDDRRVVACSDRYYRIVAVDSCDRESAPTPVSRGRLANSGVKPKPPTHVTARFEGSGARIRWRAITQDVDDQTIRIDRYRVFRSQPISRSLPPASAVWDPSPIGEVDDENDYLDGALPARAGDEILYYRVTGADECVNESDPSAAAILDCAFSGEVQFVTPSDGEQVSESVPITVGVVNGSDTYSGCAVSFVHAGSGPTSLSTMSIPGTRWTVTPTWFASPAGDYTFTATVTNASGCTQSAIIDVTATAEHGHH